MPGTNVEWSNRAAGSQRRTRRPGGIVRPGLRLTAANPDWLARVWPQVHDPEPTLRNAPWVARAWGGLQRLLHS
jgi:hypothetical protein